MVVLYIVLGLIVLILLVAALVGTGWSFEKTVLINASVERVWENVSSLKALNRWNPWMDQDPNIKVAYSGVDGTPGASFSWDSLVKNVGAGSQTIVKVTKPEEVDSRVEFLRPFKGRGDAYVRVSREAGSTRVAWGIVS